MESSKQAETHSHGLESDPRIRISHRFPSDVNGLGPQTTFLVAKVEILHPELIVCLPNWEKLGTLLWQKNISNYKNLAFFPNTFHSARMSVCFLTLFFYFSKCQIMCWDGQKFNSGFSVTSYVKTQMNFLAKPILLLCFIWKHSNDLKNCVYSVTKIKNKNKTKQKIQLHQGMKVKVKVKVAQLCLTLCDPMD